ncbi:MAG: Uma2 family endonuclease [Planctomycetes bacterium]|nr:Uma2 family endonuclease [Planctomycetota bacterium]
MSTLLLDSPIRIPARLTTLAAFRRWTRSDDFPEEGDIAFLGGEIWIDMSPEDVFAHNQVKHEIGLILGSLAKAHRLGRYFPDGIRLANITADLGCGPDGTSVSYEAFRTGRVRQIRGKEGVVELLGTPDMVLEVVSPSSIEKDTEDLPARYYRAGIPEYWLVDARGGGLSFDLLARARTGYRPVPRRRGWVESRVFGKRFKLTRGEDELGNPEFTLAVR